MNKPAQILLSALLLASMSLAVLPVAAPTPMETAAAAEKEAETSYTVRYDAAGTARVYDQGGSQMRNGWYEANGSWYYLAADGTARAKAWLFGDDGDYRYVKADGTMARSEWVDDKGLRYVDETGHRLLGAHVIDGMTCYFDTNTAALMKMSTGEPDESLRYYNGKAFIFDADGSRLRSGWYQADGDWYYLNDNATGVVKCWRLKDGNYRYLKADGTMAHDEWVQDYGDWYYCKSDGTRYESSWAQIDGEWYWFGGSGKMMKNGWLTLADGNTYYFCPDGRLGTNMTVDGYRVDASGVRVS